MELENHDCSSGKILLPWLNIKINLCQDKYFRNDGVVEDFYAHVARVYKEFKEFGAKKDYKKDNKKAYGGHIGLNLIVAGKPVKASFIFLLKHSPLEDIFMEGHESTHALIHLGVEKYLIKELKKRGFSINPFKRYADEESIAGLGGIFSLYIARKLCKFSYSGELMSIKKELLGSKI